jgi:hypothetical protein
MFKINQINFKFHNKILKMIKKLKYFNNTNSNKVNFINKKII